MWEIILAIALTTTFGISAAGISITTFALELGCAIFAMSANVSTKSLDRVPCDKRPE
jgi:uncharacterized membrane protein YqgA involved in biofilm formation